MAREAYGNNSIASITNMIISCSIVTTEVYNVLDRETSLIETLS